MVNTIVSSNKAMKEALSLNKEALNFLYPGDIVEGTVLAKSGKRIFLDIHYFRPGIVYKSEMYDDADEMKRIKIGMPLSGMVLNPENDEGYVELSLKEASRERTWLDLTKIMETSEILSLKVLEANRGGLIVKTRGILGFVPASQLSLENYPRVEDGNKDKILHALKELVGKVIPFRIIDLNQEEQKLILSEKMANSEVMDQILAKYKVGDIVHGKVTGIVDFGAFVKFDEQMEGLVHISEIDWQIVDDPKRFLKVGDEVDAKIIEIQNGRVSLSIKALKKNPWAEVSKKYKKGDIVQREVSKINPFGAFVNIGDVQGLCHVTQFESLEKMKEKIAPGQTYNFKIALLEPEEYRMALELIEDDNKGSKKESKSSEE